MKIFNDKEDLKKYISHLKTQNLKIGFVPTMGALHKGHLSLIERARKDNDIVVVSIFINPTQFDNKNDLNKYPKTLSEDIKLLKNIDCDILFNPSVKEIYSENVDAINFDFEGIENEMEGKFREGHFNGVATVVKLLFEIVTPNSAYFGQKDFQQLQIIKKLIIKEKLNIKIIGCPIFREKDGLAMSSRNVRLNKKERKAAPNIFKVLNEARKKILFGEKVKNVNKFVEEEFKNDPILNLEYFLICNEKSLKVAEELKDSENFRAFIAVYAGEVRLIDNISLKN